MKISLVIPIYNEQLELAEVLAKYVTDLKQCIKMLDAKDGGGAEGKKGSGYEIIAVNDGSSDATLNILKGAAKLNRNLRIINLDGRFGKQSAITAGMAAAKGDAVILADVDILNPVGILERVLKQHLEGSPIVYAERERFGWDAFKNSCSRGFVRFATTLFGISGRYTGRVNVMLFARGVADVINALPHKNKLLRTMDTWVDWEITHIEYASGYNRQEENEKRKAAVVQLRSSGKEPPQRSNFREHTVSKTCAEAFSWLSIFVLAVSVGIAIVVRISIVYHIIFWAISLILGFIALLLYCRAALIKRVGIIHDSNFPEEIYIIKNVVN